MNLTQTTALKWTFYALAAAALFFLRRLLLGSMTFFGVIPFLPPVILAVMASFELPRSSVIAGIVFGALCDLVLPAPFACLYTIAFTLAALLISTVVSNLLQQGFARALLSTVLTFLLVDLLQAFALLPRSGSTANAAPVRARNGALVPASSAGLSGAARHPPHLPRLIFPIFPKPQGKEAAMDSKRFTRRLIALGAAMFLCALVFVITLFDAQIVNGDDYLDKSIRTNAKTETVKASRGILTDRNGKVLVSNRAVYTLNFDSSLVSSDELNDALLRVIELMNAQGVEIKDALPLARTSPYAYDTANGSAKTLVKYLVSLKWINEKNVGDDGLPTTLTGSALYLKLRSEYGIDETLPNSTVRTLIGLRYSLASAKMNGSTTFEFASDVDVSLISLIKDGNYAGVQVDTSSVRVYETDYAAHVLGYTGSIQDWDDYKDKDGYTLASTVGISGVENAFEDYLHGSDGKRLVTLNESGKITGELYSVEPKPGSTVALTIDVDFQAQVEESLKNTVSSMTKSDGIDRGAAVAVVQVGTGDVLALASYPTYSLSTFRQDLAELSTDPLQPMWNRATQGKYAPGSTLKPLTAIAALESGATTVREKIYDSGKWTYPGYSASYTYCWKRSGHGSLNVRGAIMNSCNYFFAEMGYRMGMDTLREYYAKFGLGSPTGIEIGDTTGRLPSQNEGENLAPWAAFGQANQEYSPLQLANYIATLCGGGDRYATHLLKNVRSSGSGALEYVYDAEPVETIAMSSENLSAVLAGMHDLATDGAVSQYFKNCIVDAAAKTGTIQTGDTKNNNGAFVCFAPYDDPQIAVAIVIEKGGSGAALASTAVQVLNAYFSNTSASSAITGENTLLG